jgi:hypothetical protein
MDKYKEIANDPVKLEASLKETWAKIDAKGEGSVTFEVFEAASRKIAQELNLPKGPEPTEAEKEAGKKLVDPNNTGRINFEGFKLLIQAGIAKAKKEGKL